MALIGGQAAAIVWAQWRTLLNRSTRGRGRALPFTLIAAVVWYGIWCFFSYGVYVVASDSNNVNLLRRALPIGLFAVFAYWQLVPIMMATSGISLDLNRIRVYPVRHGELFGIEVLLRVTTAIEMVLVTAALGLGLLRNPAMPWWSALPLAPFSALNLFLSAGVRDLFTRLLARKGYRELLIFAIVLLTALPQVLLVGGGQPGPKWLRAMEGGFGAVWPWSVAALAVGLKPFAWLPLLAWTAAAYWFGRRQFERGLVFDAAAVRSADRPRSRFGLLERVLRVPSAVFRDPMAALVEKEIRVLSRSPRFRLLFLMGFSFGLLIWLPLAMRGSPESVMRTNYLTVVSVYALMLLGEVCFWNSLGMDRAAAQSYFVMPVPVRTVLKAKNISAAFFIFVEIGVVAAVCALLRMPVSGAQIGEALSVTAVLTALLFAAGNLISVRYPRSVDPTQSWRTGSMGRVQGFLLLLYPVIAAPVLLAYGARYAFESELAFYGVIAVVFCLSMIVYYVALDSAAETARERKEQMLQALSSAEGPMGS